MVPDHQARSVQHAAMPGQLPAVCRGSEPVAHAQFAGLADCCQRHARVCLSEIQMQHGLTRLSRCRPSLYQRRVPAHTRAVAERHHAGAV